MSPHYDYGCEECKITVEVFHSMKDTSTRLCSKCKKPMKKQIVTGCGFILKGEGFYAHDYKKSKELYQPMTKEEKKISMEKRIKK